MGLHALLSPSAAHRWMNCTAAPRLEYMITDEGSDYAREGTLAHAFCARHLKQYLQQDTTAEDAEILELYDTYGSGEMAEYTETYKTIVLEKLAAARKKTPDALLLVEVRLDFSTHIPEAFGTADAVIIADGMMEIIDFKYGKGVKVEAYRNPQMMIYALGAIDAFAFEYSINSVRMTIVQPRIDNLSEYTLNVADLEKWATDELRPKAEEAYKGGKQKPGVWCQFCKVKHQCQAIAQLSLQTASKAADYTNEKLVSKAMMENEVLPNIPIIKAWLAGIEEYALQQAMNGTAYKGYKVVEGRSVRKITNAEAVQAKLHESGYEQKDYLKPQELRGIGDLEKLVGKKAFAALCGIWIEKPQGKPTLVPENDKREPLNSAASDFAGIECN